jgi:7-keto-8-aminopelargonate synthetase-like enzyme
MLGAAIASARLHLSEEISFFQNKLLEKIRLCNRLIEKTRLPISNLDETPIGFFKFGEGSVTESLINQLKKEGFYVNYGMFPVVPKDSVGIRFVLTLHQTDSDIKDFIEILNFHFEKMN